MQSASVLCFHMLFCKMCQSPSTENHTASMPLICVSLMMCKTWTGRYNGCVHLNLSQQKNIIHFSKTRILLKPLLQEKWWQDSASKTPCYKVLSRQWQILKELLGVFWSPCKFLHPPFVVEFHGKHSGFTCMHLRRESNGCYLKNTASQTHFSVDCVQKCMLVCIPSSSPL